jgi:hypothetical protein
MLGRGGLDRGGRHRGKEGKDGVLVGPGRVWVCSQTRRPQDFVGFCVVKDSPRHNPSHDNLGTLLSLSSRQPPNEFHGKKLACIIFVAHVVIFDHTVGPCIFHIPVNLHRCRRTTMMCTERRRQWQRIDGRRRGRGKGASTKMSWFLRSLALTSCSLPKPHDHAGGSKSMLATACAMKSTFLHLPPKPHNSTGGLSSSVAMLANACGK